MRIQNYLSKIVRKGFYALNLYSRTLVAQNTGSIGCLSEESLAALSPSAVNTHRGVPSVGRERLRTVYI